MQKPTIGRIVWYRSRTGNYTAPAVVTATVETLAPVGLELFESSGGKAGVPPLKTGEHVHLLVFTPGLPGMRVAAQDFEVESELPRAENIGGAYQEWDVPFARRQFEEAAQPPGTWRWPERI